MQTTGPPGGDRPEKVAGNILIRFLITRSTQMTDFRALCGELLEELLARPLIIDLDLIDRARAALAAPPAPAVVPVAVSERLPRPEEMTEEEEVWVECEGYAYPIADTGDHDWEPHKWILTPIDRNDIRHNRRWLPAHALPLPSGEVDNG